MVEGGNLRDKKNDDVVLPKDNSNINAPNEVRVQGENYHRFLILFRQTDSPEGDDVLVLPPNSQLNQFRGMSVIIIDSTFITDKDKVIMDSITSISGQHNITAIN